MIPTKNFLDCHQSLPTTMSVSKPKPASDLAPLLRHFTDIDLIIETKHGKSYKGRLIEADAYMNVVLSRANDDKTDSDLHQIHIRGSTIRYIVFGSNLDIARQIREGRDRERGAADRYRRGVRKSK